MCPVCRKKSKQSITKISREEVVVCPHCHARFIVHA
nr:YnfU family zinc-binding protein [Pantoea sp. CCBC3-3-1]